MKIYLLECTEWDGLPWGDSYTHIIRGYYLKEEAEEALAYREHLISCASTWSGMRCVEYELSKLGDCRYYKKYKFDDSNPCGYEIIEIEVV